MIRPTPSARRRPAMGAAALLGAALLLPACTPTDSVDAVSTDSVGDDDFGGAPGGEALTHEDWYTDVAAAQQVARDEGKDVLMLFTGSDWCPPCQALEREVFAKAPSARIKERFVPVMLDFPRYEPAISEISAETVAQNEVWSERLGIDSFPSVVLADADGEEYARTRGYGGDDAAGFLETLDELRDENGRG